MNNTKSVFASVTFWSLLLTVAAPMLKGWGITLPDDTAGIANDIATVTGGLLTLLGRWRAEQPLHLVSPSTPNEKGFITWGMLPVLCLFAVVAACSITPKSPAQSVYAAQGAYIAALEIAVAYRRLPPCGAPAAPVLCADARIVQELQSADDVAYAALSGAQAIARSPGNGANVQTAIVAAEQAVNAFVAITSRLGVGK